MNDPSKIRIPESAVAELELVEEMDWSEGVGLEELIDWINQVVARFRPSTNDSARRASDSFSQRSFRHYQTLGCIDAPLRDGRRAVYGFRHYLQGLLIRKLLWDRVSSEQIASLMANRSTDEYKQLLFEGIEIVPGGQPDSESALSASAQPERWQRQALAPGIELHLAEGRRKLEADELRRVLERLREIL